MLLCYLLSHVLLMLPCFLLSHVLLTPYDGKQWGQPPLPPPSPAVPGQQLILLPSPSLSLPSISQPTSNERRLKQRGRFACSLNATFLISTILIICHF